MEILTPLRTLATTAHDAEEKTDILTSLGIDWTLLILQLIAFLLLVWILGKFVYPVFVRILDERQAKLDEGLKASEVAAKKAEQAEANVAKALKQARIEAADIVATAKSEASAMVDKAELSAKSRSERIVAEAQEEIAKEVIAAKKLLEKETLSLVKTAAGLAISGVADDKLDEKIIKKAVEGATQ